MASTLPNEKGGRVLVYRSRLLPLSETFVRQHADSLKRYEPVFCGLRSLNETDLSRHRMVLMEDDARRSNLRLAGFKMFGIGRAFRDAIIAERPAIIHAHFALDAADMLPVARDLDIPLLVTLHGYDVTFTDAAFRAIGPEGWIYLARRKALFNRADLFLPVSHFIEGKARETGVPTDRMKLHYLGIDLDKFNPPSERRDNAVLYVGRLVEKKGLNLLIEAMARAGANDTGTVLRVIGDGPKREEFLTLAREKLRHVDYLGPQPHSRVIAELARAQVFCVPSIPSSTGDNEGLPISYMEASAMELPVASFAQGGILEAVKNGETGLLAPTGDIDALALNLRQLISDPALCARLGKAGRAHVQAVFDARQQSARLEDIYDAVIAAHVARRKR